LGYLESKAGLKKKNLNISIDLNKTFSYPNDLKLTRIFFVKQSDGADAAFSSGKAGMTNEDSPVTSRGGAGGRGPSSGGGGAGGRGLPRVGPCGDLTPPLLV
jgi:hypothetical protein